MKMGVLLLYAAHWLGSAPVNRLCLWKSLSGGSVKWMVVETSLVSMMDIATGLHSCASRRHGDHYSNHQDVLEDYSAMDL